MQIYRNNQNKIQLQDYSVQQGIWGRGETKKVVGAAPTRETGLTPGLRNAGGSGLGSERGARAGPAGGHWLPKTLSLSPTIGSFILLCLEFYF